jgi:hypothetical protein
MRTCWCQPGDDPGLPPYDHPVLPAEIVSGVRVLLPGEYLRSF